MLFKNFLHVTYLQNFLFVGAVLFTYFQVKFIIEIAHVKFNIFIIGLAIL